MANYINIRPREEFNVSDCTLFLMNMLDATTCDTLEWRVNTKVYVKCSHATHFAQDALLGRVEEKWGPKKVRALVSEILEIFLEETSLNVKKFFSIWEGEHCRGCTLTFKHDRIFVQCSGCRHPFDVVSTVIHEMGHQMRNQLEHWCDDGHCLVWNECASHLGAIFHRWIVQTPPNQLSGVPLELYTQYGHD